MVGIASLCFLVVGRTMTLENLRCEYQRDPLGIDVDKPRLSWQLKSTERGAKQTAYRILVASSPSLLRQEKGDLWDSGIKKSDQSIQIAYGGTGLHSSKSYFWKVCAWDENGKQTSWSEGAKFATGKLSMHDWYAQWIQRPVKQTLVAVDPFDDDPAPLLRKEFSVPRSVKRATVYVSGLGYYELRLNGKKVGDHELSPGWTDFSKRVSYSTFDVTKQLTAGKNVIGAMLGNGFFNPLPLKMWGSLNLREHLPIGQPRLIAQLEVEYSDGTVERVCTDKTWKFADGPVIRNSVYLGEVYDARNELAGWDKAGFDDSGWGQAILAQGVKTDNLQSERTAPIRVTKVLKPVKITEPKPGVYIVDFGQNFAGVTRMKVQGPAGTRVRLRSGELLYDDGMLNGMTAVTGQIKGGGKDYVYGGKGQPATAFQLDEYVCRGSGVEVFQPRFTFHGFRYVEVTGYPGKPKLSDFEGLRMNSDVERVGSFECSNPMFNRIQAMMEWTLLSNLFSVQSDCPHREKFGYGGDQVATSEMAMYTFDMARFYNNAVDLLAESQRENNGFTETAPYVGIADDGLGEKSGPVEWGSAFPRLLFDLDEFYGQSQDQNNEYKIQWRKWIGFIVGKSKDYILDNGIGDHETLAPKSTKVTGSAFLNASIQWMKFDFGTMGYPDPGNVEGKMLIKDAFNAALLDTKTGKYDIGTQACQAIPLALGLVPEEHKAKVLDVLIKDIEAHNYHLTTGIFGTKYLFQALSDAGRDDIAYRIANQKTFPGWGHMLEKGATTLWEHWEFSDNTFSHNHPMFGSVSEWFYKSLLGIRTDGPGFKKIVIKPSVVADLTWAKGHHDCLFGRIATSWKKEGKKLILDVTIPPNTTAKVYVPSSSGVVLESGKAIAGIEGVRFEAVEEKSVKLAVEAGTYRFESVL